MERYEHLRLPVFKSELNRYKRPVKGGGIKNLTNRSKSEFGSFAISKSQEICSSLNDLKEKYLEAPIDPSLIFEIEINQNVDPNSFEKELTKMNLEVISIAENKKGYWVVFSNDEELETFQTKIQAHSDESKQYNFFNAVENFGNIPVDKKIGSVLKNSPLTEDSEFVDIELWRMINPSINEEFITQLENTFTDRTTFKITDRLITKSSVLLRAKLTKSIFEEIIQLKEIARVERPNIPKFSPYENTNIDLSEIEINSPDNDATGILIIDSGIISNHPLLETCIGDEQNFQSGETEVQDTVGHGTAVAGCAAYNNIDSCIADKRFSPSNWVFSAKVMYAETIFGGVKIARYDPEKLVEHQLKSAVENFLNSYETIKVVNISLGNDNEVWHKDYDRQLPLAAIIDELAYNYPKVVFIVSAGNGEYDYDSIEQIKDNYPEFLFLPENRIINPATSALALTVGSIAPLIKVEESRHGEESIITPIAEENQPSPFTRTGCGINGMIKPELVEYGGNILLKKEFSRILEDRGSKISLLNNSTTTNLLKMDYGTSYSAPKVANLAGKLANSYPDSSADFIKNLMLVGATYPFTPTKEFYKTTGSTAKNKALKKHLHSCGYGLSSFEKAVSSYENRVVLWDENSIKLDDVIAYSFKLPNDLFDTAGKKRIAVTLTYTPETRSSRGDSYLGNVMEFNVFHTIDTQDVVNHYAALTNRDEIPESLKSYEMTGFLPGTNTRKAGCHQKAIRELSQKPGTLGEGNLSVIVTNRNKWITDLEFRQNFCISIIVEHESEVDLYTKIRNSINVRSRVR